MPNLVARGEEVIEADGLIVAPGLIDLHVHVFSGIGLYSIDPFEAGLRTGVTTMLDTGHGRIADVCQHGPLYHPGRTGRHLRTAEHFNDRLQFRDTRSFRRTWAT